MFCRFYGNDSLLLNISIFLTLQLGQMKLLWFKAWIKVDIGDDITSGRCNDIRYDMCEIGLDTLTN